MSYIHFNYTNINIKFEYSNKVCVTFNKIYYEIYLESINQIFLVF
nr:MAG TPA: Pyruvate ferredoxin oxidoreductase beta subunit [Bacteriophage sp.]